MDAFKEWQLAANVIDRLNNIRARLAKNDDGDGGNSVEISRRADILHRIYNSCHIREPNRGTVMASNDERFVLFGTRDLIIRNDVGGHRSIGDLSFGEIRILGTENGLQVLKV